MLIEVPVTQELYLCFPCEDGVDVATQQMSFISTHHGFIGTGDFTFGFQMHAQKAHLKIRFELDRGIENAALHR